MLKGLKSIFRALCMHFLGNHEVGNLKIHHFFVGICWGRMKNKCLNVIRGQRYIHTIISSKLVQSLFIYVALAAACISIILVWSVSYPQSREAQAQIPISPRQCFLLQIQYSDEDIRYPKPKIRCIAICS